MGDSKKSNGAATAVAFSGKERIVIAQMLDSQVTAGYEDRRIRRRVRIALGIVPDVELFKRVEPIDKERAVVSWRLGRLTNGNGVQFATKIGTRSGEITGETADYLLKIAEKYASPDVGSELLLDIEEKLHAVRGGTYETPPANVFPAMSAASDDDAWEEETDRE